MFDEAFNHRRDSKRLIRRSTGLTSRFNRFYICSQSKMLNAIANLIGKENSDLGCTIDLS